MKKTLHTHFLLIIFCLAFCLALCSCDNSPEPNGTNSEIFTHNDIMNRSERAQKWAEENLDESGTTLISRVATDLLTVGDTTYISFKTTETLLENGDSGGPTDTQKTFQLEKIEGGKRSILSNVSEESEHLMFVEDGENLLLYYIPDLETSDRTRLVFAVTYDSGSTEKIDYTFDEKDAPAPAFYCGTLIYKLGETAIKSLSVQAFDRDGNEVKATVDFDGSRIDGYRTEPDGEYQKIEVGNAPEFFYPEYFDYAG